MDVGAYVFRGLPYLLAVPTRPTVTSGPLIVFLHGAGETIPSEVDPASTRAAWSVSRGFNPDTKIWGPGSTTRISPIGLAIDGSPFVENCVVVAPASSCGWAVHASRVLELIDEIVGKFRFVDSKRIILTGLSMGGFGTIRIGTAAAHRFAGLSPICGCSRDTAGALPALARMPLWVAHGTLDSIVPVSVSFSAVAAFRAAGNRRIVLDTFPADHDSWSATYSDPAWWGWARARRLDDGRTSASSPSECVETIRITYRSSWSPALLAFRADRGAWVTTAPTAGSVMGAASAASKMLPFELLSSHDGWQSVTVNASTLEFCVTDGAGAWDNAPGGGNYVIFEPGEYDLDAGKLTRRLPA